MVKKAEFRCERKTCDWLEPDVNPDVFVAAHVKPRSLDTAAAGGQGRQDMLAVSSFMLSVRVYFDVCCFRYYRRACQDVGWARRGPGDR